ncbi:MAG: hypothetical protein MR902_03545 [Campylobacter sp.]|nr:hypothetical protein [Campylobacter sp.]
MAIGKGADAKSKYSIGIGNDTNASAENAIAIGKNVKNKSNSALVIGKDIEVGTNSTNSIFLGTNAGKQGTLSPAQGYIDIGAKTSSWSDTINIGTNSLAYSPGSIAVGIGSQSFGGSNSYMGATAIGPYSYAKGS